MKLNNIIICAAAAAALAACSGQEANHDYTVSSKAGEEFAGQRAYLMNHDTGEAIDSVDITGEDVVFAGTIVEPVLVRMMYGGKRGPIFVLEPGQTTVDFTERTFEGTPLNAVLNDFNDRSAALQKQFGALADDSLGKVKAQEIYAAYEALADSVAAANISNPVGYYIMLNKAYDMSASQLDSVMQANPSLAQSKRLGTLRESLMKKAETSEGKMFKDFEIEYNGTTSRLSDYVGKGKYTLVDFWASWCGPCIRETATIKDLYNRFGSKGLDVLGVAVWDKPEATEEAISKHSLPWKQIINAQSIPTDLYGISGIPTIILFDPEGRIVSRGKQGDALVADVEKALNTAATVEN